MLSQGGLTLQPCPEDNEWHVTRNRSKCIGKRGHILVGGDHISHGVDDEVEVGGQLFTHPHRKGLIKGRYVSKGGSARL